MPHLPPLSRFACRLPASSTIVILLPTPQINHSSSNDAFPFVRRSATLDPQGTLLLVLPMLLLDDVALAATESVRALASGLMAWYSTPPRSKHATLGPSPMLHQSTVDHHHSSTRRLPLNDLSPSPSQLGRKISTSSSSSSSAFLFVPSATDGSSCFRSM